MKTLFTKLALVLKDATLRKRILFTLGALVLFRLLAALPIPGVDIFQLESLLSSNQFLGLLNIFSGGGLANLSIVLLGVGPYITASIIMQLGTMMSAKLKTMYQEEGEAGRMRFAQYTRYLTVPIAAIQGFSLLILLQQQGVIGDLSTFGMTINVLAVVAGSMLLTWMGELITEFGIGNGVSILIFAGIVASLPGTLARLFFTYSPEQIPLYIAFLVVAIVVTLGVVIITEAERPIPVTYAKQVRGGTATGGQTTYLPLRLNQAGVIPIIFALSILLLPQMFINFTQNLAIGFIDTINRFLTILVSNNLAYGIFYFLLVFFFTYFYTAVTFDPDQIAKNLQKGGAFVPGVRPGESTSKYIGAILSRLTLFGALFLATIAILPLLIQVFTDRPELAIGGTALLIVVSVVIDLLKKLDAQVSVREY